MQILPVRSAARDSVSFQIAIVQPRANPSVALEWRVSVPGHATIAPDDIKPGKAAEQARKSVMCAP
ncbi:MAG TPA: hypothetical protein VGS58_21845, partial [Candidatus Sulfopaludibacter sp.]|nr:hypothetical protein [Candidatus Sulfopaludibacter sp.]